LAGPRYKILRPHARGGLGEVLVALDQELHREVALKRMLKGGRDYSAGHRWFVREAEMTARLEHPGVVPIYDLQYDSDGQPYYIMKFIQGESLDVAIKRFHDADRDPKRDAGERSLALRELLNRLIAVCNTIAYVHSRGVLHRDLKPHNIMLGKYGEALVVDWGLAKSFERSEEARATGEESVRASATKEGDQETRTGDVKGSPAYMSPEQATGRIDEVGPASDIFGLGATLYAILTGTGPFQGSNALSKASRCEFTAPGKVKLGVPPALEGVCLKAMALKPEDRYETATALADDVVRWLADEPLLAFREPWADRFRRWTMRHRGFVAAMSVLFLIAAYLFGRLGPVRYYINLKYDLQPFYPPAVALLIYGLLWLALWAKRHLRPPLAIVLVVAVLFGLFAISFLIVTLLNR
jgi:serine/threonine protein kinase